ncbi:MAG: glycosyltransferase, partial [Solirubrobacteraceae bacterium]
PRPARIRAVAAAPRALTPGLAARTFAGDPLPRRVLWRDWRRARTELRRFANRPYDLVWYSHTDSLAGLGQVPARASILDTVDLEEVRLRSLRRAHLRGLAAAIGPLAVDPAVEASRTGRAAELRYRALGVASTHDAHRWGRLQRRLATAVDAAVVCSELDRDRLGVANARVIPNGCEEPATVADGTGGADGATMAMVGLFHYGPNVDGARFFAERVLPLVREHVPDAELRLIGRHDGHLAAIEGRPGLKLTGPVSDVSAELARARIAVVPLRAGSGTRLKVIEAFACGLPVVSTALGCEGIGAVDERDLLIADDPEPFAHACVRLLRDERLRARLRTNARALFEGSYRWSEIRARAGELVSELLRG